VGYLAVLPFLELPFAAAGHQGGGHRQRYRIIDFRRVAFAYADEAGVNKALLHYYFRSKEKLALAVFRRAARQLLPRLYGTLMSDAPLERKVREVIAMELDFLSEHPYVPGYVASEVHYHPELVTQVFGEQGPPPLEKLRFQLEELAAVGEIRPITPEQFMTNLISLLLFPFVARPVLGFMLGVDGERFDAFIAERRASLADFFLAGLRP
jgi:TetR/AcrR family transcriptional regulator